MTLTTPWGDELDPDAPLPEHPRPQFVRERWSNLNGRWRYAFTPNTSADPLGVPDPVRHVDWEGDIIVPFSPETALSGVNRATGPAETLWYGRDIAVPAYGPEDRVLLHFGAVDQTCRVAVDGTEVGGHTGGYLPFTLDITAALVPGATRHEVVVAVRDVTDRSWLSRGKQKTKRGGIWYTPQSGIWQTVWLEVVPRVGIDRLILTPDLAAGAVTVTVESAYADSGMFAEIVVAAGERTVAEARIPVGVPTSVALSGDVRTWSPADPFLYDVTATLGSDRLVSYVGMRSFGVGTDRDGRAVLLLNGEPHLPVGLLDQGYWPDGGYTAPSDAALRYDVELARDMGFTMLRKHIKVEAARFYHHCDTLGMLVWQDHVNGGGGYNDAIVTAPAIASLAVPDTLHRLFARADADGSAASERELVDMIETLRSVPSISLWGPFNEGWGQFDAARIAADVRRLDPTRPVDHASGWHDQGAGDLLSKHIYFRRVRVPERWRRDGRVIALTEYGGYGRSIDGHAFPEVFTTYKRFQTEAELTEAFVRLHDREIIPAIRDGLAATVYTQLSDVEDEVNGMITYDRRVVKLPIDTVRAVNDRLRAAFAETATTERTPAMIERELTEPVSLTGADGRFNPAAHGWARQPIVDTSGIDGRGTWGRNKRWEYWCVMTPTHILACTVSSIDFAAVHEVWVFDRASGTSVGLGATGIGAGSAMLPANLEGGRSSARQGALKIDIEEVPGGTRLRAEIPGASFDVTAALPDGHERLAVVVPWSATRFQCTVKDVARPATGTVTVHGRTYDVPEGSWAVLDHGRGRWPHDVRWNWGAGSGRLADGRVVGIQVGGQWTDGTGSTENSFLLGTRLHKISEQLRWEYDRDDYLRPWRISGAGFDATFTPFHDKQARTNLGVLSNRTDQCFGTWTGSFDTGTEIVRFDGIEGFAEDVHNRW